MPVTRGAPKLYTHQFIDRQGQIVPLANVAEEADVTDIMVYRHRSDTLQFLVSSYLNSPYRTTRCGLREGNLSFPELHLLKCSYCHKTT